MTEDFIKAFEQLSKLPIQRNSSTIDFGSDYMKSKEKIFKEYERVKYLEMWKKVKREFTFVNKIQPIEVNKLATNKLDYQIMRNINEKVDVISLVVAQVNLVESRNAGFTSDTEEVELLRATTYL